MKSDIDFWFSDKKGKFKLVLNPEEIKIYGQSDPEINDIVNLGQVTTLTTPKLLNFSIESQWFRKADVYYSNDKKSKLDDKAFIKRINEVRNKKQSMRVIASSIPINIEVVITDFDWWYENGDADLHYKINFLQYRKATAKFLKQVDKTIYTQQPKRENKKGFSIGDKVIVNGQLHRDSYGAGPGQFEKNATRKINFIKKGRKCPIHVTNLDGGWRGWVTESSVKHA